MRFRVLGPLTAEADDGTPLLLRRPSQRSTLAVLLLHAGRPPTRGLLIEALWGDRPPGDAETALRVRMRDVRRALAGHDRLVTHQYGYQIRIGPGELDADDFRTLAGHGRLALDQGNPEDAARLLGQACSLWRDPALADVPDTPAMRPVATELEDLRRDTGELLLDARLALGQHREVLPKIRALISEDPVCEHLHVQLMLALYRCGQKAAALQAYGRLRDLTARELGQDPGPEARMMLDQILADSPVLQFRARVLAISTDPRPAWAPVCQLPAPPPDFTGRLAAIEALARELSVGEHSVTVISGPPGVGKTALAVKAAHLTSGAFPDGQLFTGLGGAAQPRDSLEVLGELLRSLGVPAARVPVSLAERAALYRSALAGRQVLVLADDAASAAQVRPLLPGTAASAVLVTSNSRLLDVEGASRVCIGGLSTEEAVTLLGNIAGPGRVETEPDAAAAIARACAGLPLALRIAGARLAASPALRLAELAGAVSDSRALLHELVVGDLSVSRRLDTAWQTLSPASRAALRTLAREGQRDFPNSLLLAAASGARAVAQALADAGLVIESPETGHYRLAPLADCHAVAQPVPSSSLTSGE
jgi:DNA-binding SARP family transcriptional activator